MGRSSNKKGGAIISVVAWDGRTLAADRQGTSGGNKTTVTKIAAVQDGKMLYAVAFVGLHTAGLKMLEWFQEGAVEEDFPSIVDDGDSLTSLIVASKRGLVVYEQCPTPIFFKDKLQAWGSGASVALGALAMGADAKKAVEIACKYDIYCGLGIDAITVK